MDELIAFIKKQDGRLRRRFGAYPDEEKRVLARTVKLAEEFGELCNEVLSHNAMQRPDKLVKHNGETLAEEFADVIITTWLLAETLGVDIPVALEQKIKKLDERFKDV